MLTLNFYNLSIVLVILVLVKISLNQSGISRLLSVSLGCILSFSVFDSWIHFFPIISYLFRNQIESFLLFITPSLAFTPQSKVDLQRVEVDLKNTPLDNNCVKQEQGFVGQAGKGPRNQLDISSGSPSPGQWTCSSPAEDNYYCIEKTKYWANLGGCTAAVIGISEIVCGILRRLDYTKVWVNRLTDKGFPRWLFFFITPSNVEHLSEKKLSHSMVSILIINVLILFMLFNLF